MSGCWRCEHGQHRCAVCQAAAGHDFLFCPEHRPADQAAAAARYRRWQWQNRQVLAEALREFDGYGRAA